jgi:hypothetical protein
VGFLYRATIDKNNHFCNAALVIRPLCTLPGCFSGHRKIFRCCYGCTYGFQPDFSHFLLLLYYEEMHIQKEFVKCLFQLTCGLKMTAVQILRDL